MNDVRVRFQKINRRDEVVTEEKAFKSEEAAQRWVERQSETNGNFIRVVAWSD